MQDTVLTVGNEGHSFAVLCSVLHCTGHLLFSSRISFSWLSSQLYLAARHGMLWNVGEERAGDHVIQSRLRALQEGVYGGVCSLGTGLYALKFQTVSFCNKL